MGAACADTVNASTHGRERGGGERQWKELIHFLALHAKVRREGETERETEHLNFIQKTTEREREIQ